MKINPRYAIYISLFTSQCLVYSLTVPVLSLFARQLGGTVGLIGLVFAIGELTPAILRIPLGIVSDIIGRKKIMMLGLVSSLSAQLVLFFSSNLLFFLSGLVLNALGTSAFLTGGLSSISELSLRKNSCETMGRWSMVYGLSIVIGNLLGGFLTNNFLSFTDLFLASFVFGSVVSITSFFILSETHHEAGSLRTAGIITLKNAFRDVLNEAKNVQIAFSVLSIFISSFCLAILDSIYPLYASSIGVEISMIGIMLASSNLFYATMSPYFGRLADRIGKVKPIVVSFLLQAMAFVCFALFREILFLVLLCVVLSLSRALVNASTLGLISENTNRKGIGKGMGLWGTMMHSGKSLGSCLLGLIANSFGFALAFYANSVIMIISAIVTVSLVAVFSRRGKMLSNGACKEE